MNASVLFRWNGPEDGHYQGEGVTRDMSVSGAFVLTTTCPPPNSVVEMEVFFPLSDDGSKALMKADMIVMRVEHEIGGEAAKWIFRGREGIFVAYGFGSRVSVRRWPE